MAIWVKDGVIQGTRSNIDIELEIIDIDSNMSRRMGRWYWDVGAAYAVGDVLECAKIIAGYTLGGADMEWSDYALINADTRDAAEAKWKTSETELPFEIY